MPISTPNRVSAIKLFAVVVLIIGTIISAGLLVYQNQSYSLTDLSRSTPSKTKTTSPTASKTVKKSPSFASITLTLDAKGFQSGSPADLLVTDPQGRRTGVDPRTGITYQEIPDAFYYVEALADDTGQGGSGHPYKIFDMSAPPNGSYIIQVIGTGSGSYTLDILNYDELGNPASTAVSGQIEESNVDAYRMDYSSTPGAGVVVVSIDQRK